MGAFRSGESVKKRGCSPAEGTKYLSRVSVTQGLLTLKKSHNATIFSYYIHNLPVTHNPHAWAGDELHLRENH
jgi:hypothetical protein